MHINIKRVVSFIQKKREWYQIILHFVGPCFTKPTLRCLNPPRLVIGYTHMGRGEMNIMTSHDTSYPLNLEVQIYRLSILSYV
jgi:hypothetical protein